MKYTVISFFDGISCGRIALERAGIEFDNYYAFEVDKNAIKISQANYPDIIQCGSVTDCSYCDGFLFTRNGWFEIGKNVLFIGGSPCQGFSFAGKQLNFDDPRSKLFFEYVKMLRSLQYDRNVKFMLENVKMKKEYENVITEKIGVNPVMINSALVSAQNRKRLYWCNWSVNQPEDKHIYLKDVIELSNHSDDIKCGAFRGRYLIDGKRQDGKMLTAGLTEQRLELRNDDKTNTLTTVQKDNVIVDISIIQKAHGFNKGGIFYKKSPAMTSSSWQDNNHLAINDIKWRKLTPTECERLQTVPDNYTNHVANTHRYHALGNGWTVDVIAHILGQMDKK